MAHNNNTSFFNSVQDNLFDQGGNLNYGPSGFQAGTSQVDLGEKDEAREVGSRGEIGGAAAKGALKGASAGAALGPIGMAVGAVVGGAISFFGAKKRRKKEEEAEKERQKKALEARQDNYEGQIGGVRSEAFNQDINEPINPIAAGFAMGGFMGGSGGNTEINSTDVNTFNEGGSHEVNPLGGVPQGTGPNGKPNLVEEGEVKIKKGQGESYVFSDRLIFE